MSYVAELAFAEEFPDCQKIILCYTDKAYRTQDNVRVEPVGTFLHDGFAEFCTLERE